MKSHKKRVLFGKEKFLYQIAAEKCKECGCNIGKVHAAGCSEEECPECGMSLVGCCCEVLAPYDAEKVIQALYNGFNDLETAMKTTEHDKCSKSPGTSYLQHALMRFIFDSVPEATRNELGKVFHLRFPGLVPQLQDDEGKGYYTAEQLSKALDIPLDEINERIEAMVAAGKAIPTNDLKKLRKVH